MREIDDDQPHYSSPISTQSSIDSPKSDTPCDYSLIVSVARHLKKRYPNTEYDDILSDVGFAWITLNKKSLITGDHVHDFRLLRQASSWRMIDSYRVRTASRGVQAYCDSLDRMEEKQDLDQYSSLGTVDSHANLEIEWIASHMNPRVHAWLQGASMKEVARQLGISASRVQQLVTQGMQRAGYAYRNDSWEYQYE